MEELPRILEETIEEYRFYTPLYTKENQTNDTDDSFLRFEEFVLCSETYSHVEIEISHTVNYFATPSSYLFVVKYVKKAEVELAKKAVKLSSISVPVQIGWLDKVKTKHQYYPFDAILCMKYGRSLQHITYIPPIYTTFQRLTNQ